jgi:hypothetical protein
MGPSRPLLPAKKMASTQNLDIIIDQTKPNQSSFSAENPCMSYIRNFHIRVDECYPRAGEFHSFEIDLIHIKDLYTLHLIDIASKTSFQETLIFFLP